MNVMYNRVASHLRAELNCAAGSLSAEKLLPPRNFTEAMKRGDYEDWLHAADIEMSGLEDMKVFSKGSYTIRELWRRGIDRAPMPVSLIYDRKLNPDLSFSKNKARSKKGIHGTCNDRSELVTSMRRTLLLHT